MVLEGIEIERQLSLNKLQMVRVSRPTPPTPPHPSSLLFSLSLSLARLLACSLFLNDPKRFTCGRLFFCCCFLINADKPDVFCFSSNIHVGRGTVSLISPTV